MGFIYKVQNFGSSPYNNFTFTDGNGVNKIVDLIPNIFYYIVANVATSPDPYVSVYSLGKYQLTFCFKSCCNNNIFSIKGFNFVITSYQIGDVYYFNAALFSSNPNEIKSGCYELISFGPSGVYTCSVALVDNVVLYSFNNTGIIYLNCSSCLIDPNNECCVNYDVINQSPPNVTTTIEFTPCCNETKESPYIVPYNTSITICSSSGIKTLIGEIQVINNGSCNNCTITTTIFPIVTTTTTFNPLVPINTSIEPKNECSVITIFPLGIKCFTIDPFNYNSFDGSITLGITGGTPPYEVVWENGSLSQSLTNLGVGEYSSMVTDYYGDFTAYTTCVLSAEVPITTTTSTIKPIPNYEDICITIVQNNMHGIFTDNYYFIYNGYIGDYPTWTDTTNSLDIIWSEINTEWELSGWTISQIINSNSAIPPISGWISLGVGLYNQITVTAILGLCQPLNNLNLQVRVNNVECGCDGSLMLTPFGGSPPYQYSIDGGASYNSTTIYNNLCSGIYSIYVIDSLFTTHSQTATIGSSSTTSVNYVLTMTYGINTFSVSISPSLPIGTTITFDVTHEKYFNVSPSITSASYNNVVTLNVNGLPVAYTPPPIIFQTQVSQVAPCETIIRYHSIDRFIWSNLSMTFGTTINGSFTNMVSPVLPIPPCYIAAKACYIYINNVSINTPCDTIRVVNPVQPQIK